MTKPGPLTTIALALDSLARRVIDRHEIDARRLAAIEDRLQALDAGENHEAALRSAFARASARRDEAGGRPLTFTPQIVNGRLVLAPREVDGR